MSWPDAAAIAAAYVLDWAVGDPPRPTHPVVLIGRAITALEARLHPWAERRGRLLAAGGLLTLVVVGGTWAVAWVVLDLARRMNPWLGWALEVWWLQVALATRGLAQAAMAVERPTAAGDLAAARAALPALVGRDTEGLPAEEIRRAVIESVAENTSDAVLAPLFWAALGGAPLALAYKAVNTLDSMVGHQNARYALFGRVSARLDDAANWLPARVGGLVTLAAAGILGRSVRGGWRAWRQDANHHPSPNAGIGEAIYAGTLGLRLGGASRYGGEVEERGVLHAVGRSPAAGDVRRALWLLAATATLGAALAALGRWWL